MEEERRPLNNIDKLKEEIIPKDENLFKFQINHSPLELVSMFFYNLNTGIAIAMMLVYFAILNQNQMNNSLENNKLPNEVFIITSIFSLFSSFVVSGDLNIFRSFSITNIIFLFTIMSKFGINSLPIVILMISINFIIFTIIRLSRFVYLIPKNIFLSMTVIITIYLILLQIANFNTLIYKPTSMNIFDVLKFFDNNKTSFTVENILLFLFSIILACILFIWIKKVPWFIVLLVFGNLGGWLVNKYQQTTLINNYFIKDTVTLRTYFEENIKGFLNFKTIFTQEFYLYCLALSLLMFFESSLTIKLARYGKNAMRQTNYKTEMFGLIISNLLGSVIGCLPMSLSFTNNYIIKQTGNNNKISFFVAVVFLILFGIPIFLFIRQIPLVVINIFICSLAIIGIDYKAIHSMFKYNKKYFTIFILSVAIGFFIDIIYMFCLSLIVFYFIYFLHNEDVFYMLEEQGDYMSKVIAYQSKYLTDNKDEINLYHSKLDLDTLKSTIVKEGIIYQFKGCFNFFFHQIHLNNLAFINKEHVILDFSTIIRHDYDFIDEYYKLVKNLEDKDYIVYISGIKKDRYENDYNLNGCSWLNDKYLNGKLLFCD